MILSILLATLTPLIFLYIIWSLEIYALARFKLLLVALGWGVVAFGIALAVQTVLLRAGILSLEQVTLVSAPILEEVLKAALIIVLAARMWLRYAVDGTAYGFAIGTGFAIGENLLYLNQNPGSGLDLTLARLLSTTLMHTFTTAVVGTVAGNNIYLSNQARMNRVLAALTGVMAVHAIFNQIASTQHGFLLLVMGTAIGMGSTGILILLINQHLKKETRSIEGELSDTLSRGELAATLHPEAIAATLSSHRAEVDPRRAHLIQEYITLQAQRAIIKKGQGLSRRPKLSRSLENQLQNVEQQLATLRSEMGLYTWIWLRTVVPSEESAMWTLLGNELGAEEPVIGLVNELSKRQGEVSAADLAVRKDLLREARLFHNLEDEDLNDLAMLLHEQQCIVTEDIIEQGVVDGRLYIVASGHLVAGVVDAQGKDTIITTYDRGSSFGELTLLDGEPYPAYVTCVSEVVLYSLARADFLILLYAKPQVGVEMIRHLVDHIRRETALLQWLQQNNS
jgi:CRP-like cAMP-binding protein/RsiW-degrading membrane proteinase PrsW (M82 family)